MNIEKFTTALTQHISRELAKERANPQPPPAPDPKICTPTRADADELDQSQPKLTVSQETDAHMSLCFTAATHLARFWKDKTDQERADAIARIQRDPNASLYPPAISPAQTNHQI